MGLVLKHCLDHWYLLKEKKRKRENGGNISVVTLRVLTATTKKNKTEKC